MKSKLFLFTLLIACFGCQTENSQPDPNASIADLEAAIKTNDSPAYSLALANKYFEYANTNTQDGEKCADYLNKAATFFDANNKTREAVASLNLSIRNHFESSKTADNAAFLAKIYKDKLPNSKLSQYVKQSIVTTFPNYKDIAEIKKYVPDNTLPLEAELASLSSRMTNTETGRLEPTVANDFLNLSEIMAMFSPKSDKTPEYLQKAGEVARSIRAFPKAVDIYNWIVTKYPQSKYAPQALFMLAFTYDNELQEKGKAKDLYNEFLRRYPDDEFADDTEFLLNNLSKSNEEIIEGFGGKLEQK